MPVFERPYLKKNSNGPRSDPIFGVYAYEPNGNSYESVKLQIWGHEQLTLLIWPRKNGHNRSTRLCKVYGVASRCYNGRAKYP